MQEGDTTRGMDRYDALPATASKGYALLAPFAEVSADCQRV